MRLTEEQIACVQSLEDADGRITPDRVLEEAKRKDSPIHALFDWDKNKAAHNWWLECAREVIGAVRIQVETTEAVYKPQLYMRDPDVSGQGYRSVLVMKRDPVTARQALIGELTRAAGVVHRARELAVALGLNDEVDQMLGQIVGMHARLVQEEQKLAKAS